MAGRSPPGPLVRLALPLSAALLLLVACGAPDRSGEAGCAPIEAAEAVREDWDRARGGVDFGARLPCGWRSLRLTAASLDRMPGGDGFVPRLNVVVEASGHRAFTFSQTRALVPYQAIPQWSRPFEVTSASGATRATGFAGTSATGPEAYLRWRAADVTYEVVASFGPGFDRSRLRELVRAMLNEMESR